MNKREMIDVMRSQAKALVERADGLEKETRAECPHALVDLVIESGVTERGTRTSVVRDIYIKCKACGHDCTRNVTWEL